MKNGWKNLIAAFLYKEFHNNVEPCSGFKDTITRYLQTGCTKFDLLQ